MKVEEGFKYYLLEFADKSGRAPQVIKIPETWKVTFGAVVPSTPASSYGGEHSWGVRVYETKDKQRAVFAGVKEMRDLSIPMEPVTDELKLSVVEKLAQGGSEVED